MKGWKKMTNTKKLVSELLDEASKMRASYNEEKIIDIITAPEYNVDDLRAARAYIENFREEKALLPIDVNIALAAESQTIGDRLYMDKAEKLIEGGATVAGWANMSDEEKIEFCEYLADFYEILSDVNTEEAKAQCKELSREMEGLYAEIGMDVADVLYSDDEFERD